MYYLLIFVHVITCLFLIASILLQAGRGGGLTEAFQGQTQSVLGTQAPHVLKKATTIGAIVFITLSLVLAMYTSRRGRSLFERSKMPLAATMPAMPASESEGAGSSQPQAEDTSAAAEPSDGEMSSTSQAEPVATAASADKTAGDTQTQEPGN